jgi:hypothetical protein
MKGTQIFYTNFISNDFMNCGKDLQAFYKMIHIPEW